MTSNCVHSFTLNISGKAIARLGVQLIACMVLFSLTACGPSPCPEGKTMKNCVLTDVDGKETCECTLGGTTCIAPPASCVDPVGQK